MESITLQKNHDDAPSNSPSIASIYGWICRFTAGDFSLPKFRGWRPLQTHHHPTRQPKQVAPLFLTKAEIETLNALVEQLLQESWK